MRVTLRPARLEDFLAIQQKPPAYRCRCIAAEVDGRVLGVGGVVWPPGGGAWASMLMAPEGRRYPAAILRAGRAAVALFEEMGLRGVLATAQPGNPRAEAFMRRLGFCEMELAGQRVFVWRRVKRE